MPTWREPFISLPLAALLHYLRDSGRLGTMDAETAQWTSHDRSICIAEVN